MDQLERIANLMDGGDANKGTVNEKSYLERIANSMENGSGSSSGGSSSGGDGTLRVNFTIEYDVDEETDELSNIVVTADKTPNEIYEAFNSGKYVYGYVESAHDEHSELSIEHNILDFRSIYYAVWDEVAEYNYTFYIVAPAGPHISYYVIEGSGESNEIIWSYNETVIREEILEP